MKRKLKAHLITLPRWFALPCAVCPVLLGIALGGNWSWLSLMVVLGALFEMAGGHSWNSFLDKEWTHFDEGRVDERSKEKVYTGGQNIIEKGIVRSREVLANALGWYAISAIFISIVAWKVSPIIWAIWGVTALCTFWYSWGKLHWSCELALGTGFGPLAVMLGMATQPNPDFLTAFLAGIPFLILWGYGAETIDQFTDAEPNWPRGLRNFGALLWKNNISISMFLAWLLTITFLSQLFLIASGILAPLTALSLISFIPFSFCLLYLETNLRVGILWGLGGIFLHMVLLTTGQILGG